MASRASRNRNSPLGSPSSNRAVHGDTPSPRNTSARRSSNSAPPRAVNMEGSMIDTRPCITWKIQTGHASDRVRSFTELKSVPGFENLRSGHFVSQILRIIEECVFHPTDRDDIVGDFDGFIKVYKERREKAIFRNENLDPVRLQHKVEMWVWEWYFGDPYAPDGRCFPGGIGRQGVQPIQVTEFNNPDLESCHNCNGRHWWMDCLARCADCGSNSHVRPECDEKFYQCIG